MSAQSDLVALLRADSGVRAHVSSGSPLVHRIYPEFAPERAVNPLIVYSVLTATNVNTLDSDKATVNSRFLIDCWADDPATAIAMADAVETAVAGQGYITTRDYATDGQEYRARLEYSIWS